MNLSFACVTVQRKSRYLVVGRSPYDPARQNRDICVHSVSMLTALVERGQKLPVGPAFSDNGCTVNIRKYAVCRGYVIKRRNHGAVRHGDDHCGTVLHVDKSFPCALFPHAVNRTAELLELAVCEHHAASLQPLFRVLREPDAPFFPFEYLCKRRLAAAYRTSSVPGSPASLPDRRRQLACNSNRITSS